MNEVQQTVLDSVPARARQNSSGWWSFNAVCCHHNGESEDRRGRGGIITNGEAVSYHCFNCNFKTGWQPGRHIGFRFRRLLTWLGVDEATINRLKIEALRIKEYTTAQAHEEQEFVPEFEPRPLPDSTVSAEHAPRQVQEYIISRGLNPKNFLYSNTRPAGMWKRFIIPCTYNNQLIGYTARTTDPNSKPKYHNSYDGGFVYNMDNQNKDRQFVVVTEGIIDAISIDGVAVLGNRCSDDQAQLIDTLAREIILVPDRDQAGQQLIDDAIEYGWSVSFPEWEPDVKDINDSVVRYGKLFTLKSILDNKETSSLKINLKRKKYF